MLKEKQVLANAFHILEEVPPKMYCISSIGKNIYMNLHSKAGVSKNVVSARVSIFTFLPTPALEYNLSEIILQTPALECIFGDTWSSDIFAGTSLPCSTGGEGGIEEGGGVRGGVIGE